MELLDPSRGASRFLEPMRVHPPMKLKVFVDDLPAFMEGRIKELALRKRSQGR